MTQLETQVPAENATPADVKKPAEVKKQALAEVKKLDKPKAAAISPLLSFILSSRRAHLSKGETDFCKAMQERFIKEKHIVVTHPEGCFSVEIGEGSKTLFSCHTDTVHSYTESDGRGQILNYDPDFGHLFLDPKEVSGCLGADDGAGIFVMVSMMDAGVPGTYMFHRGEEKGGIGSRAILAKTPEFLKKFDRCVAFDRPNLHEVICTQGGQECASLAAGTAFAAKLTALGLPYEVSHKGSFTDSKVYRGIIRECFNLSVGYFEQHGKHEYLNVEHLTLLTAACIKLEWETIPTVRVAVDEPKVYSGYASSLSRAHAGYQGAAQSGKGGKGGKQGNKGEEIVRHTKGRLPDLFAPELAAEDEAENMSLFELETWTGDEEVAHVIAKLQIECAAEKARVVALQRLLGI